MNKLKYRLAACLGMVLAVLGVVASNPQIAQAGGISKLYFNNVTCTSNTHCVAVGYYTANGTIHPLIKIYNGTNWTIATGTDPQNSTSSNLSNVTCTSNTHCVAVGYYTANSVGHSLIETYNGTNWTIATSTDPQNSNNASLNNVTCTSSTSCVAVGTYTAGGTSHPLIKTYDGTNWTVATSTDPQNSSYAYIGNVTCTSSTHCVTVGNYIANGINHSLIETYNGTNWTIVTGTDPQNSTYTGLRNVTCTSSTSCVAVGTYRDTNNTYYSLIETYNGTNWTIATGTDPQNSNNASLNNVTCTSSTSCVAVGTYTAGGTSHPLIKTYNGTNWTIATGTDPQNSNNASLNNVTCTSNTSCVAVGGYIDGDGVGHSLIETYNGTNWTIVSGGLYASTNLVALNLTSTGVDLHWQAPSQGDMFPDVQYYIVEYQINGAGVWNVYKTSDATTSLHFTGLISGADVTFRVKAVDGNLDPGQESNTVTIATPGTGAYVINSCQDLQNMNNNLSGANYSLGQDIDCSDTVNWNGGKGFIPIGSNDGTGFTGSFNGAGHSITGLYENQPLDNGTGGVGLFSNISFSTITNLTLINPNINSSLSLTGSLAALSNTSAIANVQVTAGTVVVAQSGAGSSSGGLVGKATNTTIIQSSYSGLVVSDASEVGGLVGTLGSDAFTSALTDTFAQVVVDYTGTDLSSVGGLVGASDAVISSSYAGGNISLDNSSGSHVGGIIGVNNNTGPADIVSSFSNVSLDISNDLAAIRGGLVGSNLGNDSVLHLSDYFDASQAGTNSCTGDANDSCSSINTISEWTIATGTDPQNSSYANLGNVTCTSSTHCVAAGGYTDANSVGHSLIETYNGTNWTIATGTDPQNSTSSNLSNVTCTSSTHCVAVGGYYDTNSTGRPLIKTYDGTNWTVATGTDPQNNTYANISSVTCTSSTHCVAAGYYYDTNSIRHTLIETYNGTNWTIASGTDPQNSTSGNLSNVTCTSSTSCVAVGTYVASSTTHTLIETYNGTNWTIASGTDPQNSTYASLSRVTCTSNTHCVAVGYYVASSTTHTLIETYNGTNWTIATGTDPQNSNNASLNNVTCTSSTSCVAVGGYTDANSVGHSLIETYNGSSWTVTMSNDIRDSSYPYLGNVTCTSSTSCVATGSYTDIDEIGHTLIQVLIPGTAATNPQPSYFLNNATSPPLSSWDFSSIWLTTVQLPKFIPGRYVIPVQPQPNPYYKEPAPSASPAGRPKSPIAAAASDTSLPDSSPAIVAKTGASNSTKSTPAPTPDSSIVEKIKDFLRHVPVPVLVAFPYVLFTLVAIGIGFMAVEMGRQAHRLKVLQGLIARQRAIAQQRDTFWHLAANYLRAPITLLMGGVDLLGLNAPKAKSLGAAVATDANIAVSPSPVIDKITKLVFSMQANVQQIMQRIEGSKTLRGISWPKAKPIRSVFTRASFWLPLLAVAGFSVLANYVIYDFRKLNISSLNYLTQAMFFFLVSVGLYWVLSSFGIISSKRRQAEDMLAAQAKALHSARTDLVSSAATRLDRDVSSLESALDALPKDNIAAPTLHEGARRLRSMIDSFHLLSSAENGVLARLSPSGSTSDLGNVLADALKAEKPTINTKHITIDAPDLETFVVPGAAQLTQQVLGGVLSNAIAFSPDSATIRLELLSKPGYRGVAIHDDGKGVSKEQLAHMFEPFTKADGDDALRMNHEGLGIDLYLSKLIMQFLNGSIAATSTQGQGTTVSLWWPSK